jgi:murein peptide amidase A
MSRSRWAMTIVVLAASLSAPSVFPAVAFAGGTALTAPEYLGHSECRQGDPAPFEGVPAPLPPTVIGCAALAAGEPALVAVQRWPTEPDQVCFFAAPAGEVDVDGSCTTSDPDAENALSGARGVFAVQVKHVGGRNVYAPDTTIVSGISRSVRRISVHFHRRGGGPGGFRWAAMLPIGPGLSRRLGGSGRLSYFVAKLPGVDSCGPIKVSGADPDASLIAATRSAYPGPGSRSCVRRAAEERLLDLVVSLGDVIRGWMPQLTPPDPGFLDFAETPRRPGNLLSRMGVAGRSAHGREIRLLQHGDPEIEGDVLVFGCVHGDECGARHVRPLAGCPWGDADIYTVPNLNPDGLALGTRLNGRGVDLNRNFPSDWKPIGSRGSPQYSGPRTFSEPETRLAARIIREIEPEVTIWFHQHHEAEPLVRAWGRSAPMARRYAALARLPFRRLPWLAGTAPNWQNHAFPGTASFVVEMPRGTIGDSALTGLGIAVLRLAREVADHGRRGVAS